MAADPVGVGGLYLRARPGPVRDRFLDVLGRALGSADDCHGSDAFVSIPAHTTSDRLSGGIDLAATLDQGRLVNDAGLLTRAHGHAVLLSGVERFNRETCALIEAAMDGPQPERFAVVAIDESGDGEDATLAAEALRDRLAFAIDLTDVSIRDAGLVGPDAVASEGDLVPTASRKGGPRPDPSEDVIARIVSVADAFAIPSLRAPLFCLRVAELHAAVEGRALLNHADIEAAVVLVLAPRARQLPADDETEDASEPPPPRDETSTTDNNPPPDQSNAEPLAPLEQLIAATRAALPAQLLASLAQGLSATSGTAGGRAGGKSKPARHGRAYGARKSVPRRGDRLHLIETLRAAVPWQTIRRREAGGRGARANGHQDHRRLHVRRDDLRIYRRKDLSETLA
ncbi:MAG: magnesium chelatase ATPase subunit D, partial [Pseudomonadota bacterium]